MEAVADTVHDSPVLGSSTANLGAFFELAGPDGGQYTDDTQMTRELARSIICCGGGLNPEDFMGRLGRLAAQGSILGIGSTTNSALQRFLSGVHWREAAKGFVRPSNGSAMRTGACGPFPAGISTSCLRAHIRVAAARVPLLYCRVAHNVASHAGHDCSSARGFASQVLLASCTGTIRGP